MIKIGRYFFVASFVLVMALCFEAQARGRGVSVAETASASCVAQVSPSDVDARLRDFDVKVNGASPAEKQKIASAINTIMVNGGPGIDGAFRNLSVNVRGNLTGGSGREIAGFGGASAVSLNRKVFEIGGGSRANAYSESTLVHELGHSLANRRGLYGKYNKAVPSKCTISTYCTHRTSQDGRSTTPHASRNEEFAEVFAAYFFNPQALKRQCPASYQYLNEQVFRKADTNVASCKPTGFFRGYQRADGNMADIVGAGVAPTPGGTVYVNFEQFWAEMSKRRTINEATPHEEERPDEYERLTAPARNAPSGSQVAE